jgi:streptogramin lyase
MRRTTYAIRAQLAGRFWPASWAAGVVLAVALAASPAGAGEAGLRSYRVPTSPVNIVAGPQDALWMTGNAFAPSGAGDASFGPIVRLAANGDASAYPQTNGLDAYGITEGGDGNLWFTEFSRNMIGRLTPGGGLTEFGGLSGGRGYYQGQASSHPTEITSAHDGSLWFSEEAGSRIGHISTSGVVNEFDLDPDLYPGAITVAADANLWLVYKAGIGRITPTGTITLFPGPTGTSITPAPPKFGRGVWVTGDVFTFHMREDGYIDQVVNRTGTSIAVGPDNNLWLNTDYCCDGSPHKVLRIALPSGHVTTYTVGRKRGLVVSQGANRLTSGPKHSLWITDIGGKVWRLTPP